MPDNPAEFDDGPEPGDDCPRLLPQDDRIWRHPSELRSSPVTGGGPPGSGGFSAAGRADRAGRAGRAGTWSAGVAGALLATGLVLVGSHLATDMSRTSGVVATPSATAGVLTTTVLPAKGASQLVSGDEAEGSEGGITVGSQLATATKRVYDATVLVQAARGTKRAAGAGLVIGRDCLVIVPSSVIPAGAAIHLTLPDGQLVPANLVGTDPETGITLLRCPVGGLTTIPDATPVSSHRATVATHEMVLLVFSAPHAIGISVGLVSAVDQRVPATKGGTPLLDEIETDIPATDAGAALVDGAGEVVGVVVGSSGANAVATPTWLAVSVAKQLASSRRTLHAWLGIDGGNVTSAGKPDGVRVLAVQPKGAAAGAGIRPGDLIRSLDGHSTTSLPALQAQLYCLTPGTPAAIGIVRGNRTLVEHTTLGAAPAA